MRGIQRVLLRLNHPQPVAHGRSSTSIQFAAAAGKLCGVDASHFRTGEPSDRWKSNILGQPGATHVLAGVSSVD